MKRERRGNLYLITGLLIGIAAGLLYAWFWQPVEYIDTAPASLRADLKDQYRSLISSAYLATGDLVRAQARLALIGDPDPYRALADQAQRLLAQSGSPEDVQALGLLALALNPQTNPALETTSPAETNTPALPVEATTSPVSTPTTLSDDTFVLTATILSNATTSGETKGTESPFTTPSPPPTATQPFALKSMEQLCDQAYAAPLLAVETFDSTGQPVSGVEIIVSWAGGEEHFFTGLKPELGLGYADFTLAPDQKYSLRLPSGGQPINDLQPVTCNAETGNPWGAWLLIFTRP